MTNPDERITAVVLLSGGLDSTVSLALSTDIYDLREAIFFDYSQAAAEKEKEAASAIAGAYGLPLRVVGLPWLGEASSSGLTGGEIPDFPVGTPSGAAEASRAVWVENRNGLFINIAAVFAAPRASDRQSGPDGHAAPAGLEGEAGRSAQARPARIITGFNREEAETFPDNSAAFVEAINESLSISAGFPVLVEAPTVSMDKREIARRGLSLGIPWGSLWSCYHGGQTMCGRCESCYRMKRAVAGTAAEEKLVFAG